MSAPYVCGINEMLKCAASFFFFLSISNVFRSSPFSCQIFKGCTNTHIIYLKKRLLFKTCLFTSTDRFKKKKNCKNVDFICCKSKQTVWFVSPLLFLSHIYCAENAQTGDCTLIKLKSGGKSWLPLFFPVISGLPWDENGSGIVGNDRCGSGEPLKRSYVITGSHAAFEQGPKVGVGSPSHTTWRDKAWECS